MVWTFPFYLRYYAIKALFYLWSLLPMPLLHLQSSVLAFLLHRVFRYRRKVALENIRQAFPDKSDAEHRRILRDFYAQFCDTWFETLKMLSMSRRNLRRRMECLNPEEIPRMTAHGGGGIAIFAHYANWEWLGAGMGIQLPFSTVGVFKPQSSLVFDKLILDIRTRFGNDMIGMSETYRESIKRLKEPCYIAFLGDQRPMREPGLYFVSFLGRPAAAFLGVGVIALKLEVPVYYFDIRRKRRGYYTVMLRRVDTAPFLPYSKENARRFTDHHLGLLEAIIREEPAPWLWTHKRWKHVPQEGDILSPALDNANPLAENT